MEKINKLFLSPEQFLEQHGKLQEIYTKNSPFTTIYKSFDNKLVKRIIFLDEEDFRQWLPSLKFEMLRQNDLAELYPDYILKIQDYSYERHENKFKFYIAYDYNPDYLEPLFKDNHDLSQEKEKQHIEQSLKILEIGIILQNTGVCHSNIKPSNFLLDRNKTQVLLTDFGSMRTHHRNYYSQYQTQEEKKWQNNTLFYQSHEHLEAFQSENTNMWQNALKPKSDQWALGIIILQLFHNDSTQKSFEKYYGRNQKSLKYKINFLRTKIYAIQVADPLDFLLFKKYDIKEVYQQMCKFSTNPPIPLENLECKVYLKYDQTLLFTTKLDKIRDQQTNLQNSSRVIEAPAQRKASISIQNTGLQSKNTEPERINPEKSFDKNKEEQNKQVVQGGQNEVQENESIISIPEPELSPNDPQNIQSEYNNGFFIQIPSTNNLKQTNITVTQFKQIESQDEQEKKLAELFDLSFNRSEDRSDIQYLSTLNFILEHHYEDINMQEYKFKIQEQVHDSDIAKSFIAKQKINIPICYFPYLKKFNNLKQENNLSAYFLNKQPHGLGTMITQEGLFQGIFHQGLLLWGNLFNIRQNHETLSIYQITGSFDKITQKIEGEESQMHHYQFINDGFQLVDEYKGRMVDGNPQWKSVRVLHNKNQNYVRKWENWEQIDEKNCQLMKQTSLQSEKGCLSAIYDKISRATNDEFCSIF